MKKVYIIGIGMGSPEGITVEGKLKIEESNLIIGAKRMLSAFAKKHQTKCDAITSADIFEQIKNAENDSVISVLMSGDIGFYSGAKKLREIFVKEYGNFLGNDEISINYIPGISSFVYFLSKLGMPWEDVVPVSLHGRETDPLGAILAHNKVFFLTDSKDNTVKKISKKFQDAGFNDLQICVGENLSYPNERITVGTTPDFVDTDFDPLSVMYVEKTTEKTDEILQFKSTLGINDELFIRTKVPMTKEEVRTVAVSKMNLKQTDCVYDIGAGTGSVSIELALTCKNGKVYAIEIDKDAVALIKENKDKFKASNLDVIYGGAPEAMSELPKPDKAFIGGSKGNLKEIIADLLMKNPDIRIVATAVSLEAIGELTSAIKHFEFVESEVVQLSVARSKKLGNYNLMMGQNPVFIVTMQYGKIKEELNEKD
ncbi:MAG: precorrin-6y C5,15-methyltransferase (decarboxylating) subunit CbiE [Eubacteriales bacterium]